jgi:hypothetical protein
MRTEEMKFTTFAMVIAMTGLAGAAAAQVTMQPIPNPPEKVVKHHHKAAKPAKAVMAPAATKS